MLKKILDEFWADDSVFEIVEFHDEIARMSRHLIRSSITSGQKVIKPMDAIHLATAKWVGVSEFHTYNLKDFQRFQPEVKFKICEPHIVQPKLLNL